MSENHSSLSSDEENFQDNISNLATSSPRILPANKVGKRKMPASTSIPPRGQPKANKKQKKRQKKTKKAPMVKRTNMQESACSMTTVSDAEEWDSNEENLVLRQAVSGEEDNAGLNHTLPSQMSSPRASSERAVCQERLLNRTWPSASREETQGDENKLDLILAAVKELQTDMNESNSRLDVIEKQHKKSRAVKVVVDRAIVDAVHDGYKQGRDRGLSWTVADGMRLLNDFNKEMNEHIEQFVKGRCPTGEPAAVFAAMKRYYQTKKEEYSRVKNNKSLLHKKNQVKYERKKEKANRRERTIIRKQSWGPQKKKQTREVLKRQYMSTDESGGEGGFITRVATWRSEEFQGRLDELDTKFMAYASDRSKRQLAKRSRGEPSTKPPPLPLREEDSWIFNEG